PSDLSHAHEKIRPNYESDSEIFGIRRRRVAYFEQPVQLLGGRRGYLDLFWKGTLLVEQKSAGRALVPAKKQALDYFPGLTDDELPRYLLLSDFQNFELYDLDEGTEIRFRLADLPQHVEAFGFIMGVQARTFRDQDPVNLRASALMQRLHDDLKASGFEGHALELLLVRLLFCLFADDTGIFPERGMFQAFLAERTRADGSDVGPLIGKLFEVLNQAEDRRQTTLDADLALFPYVNGELFAERLPLPDFDGGMRATLLEASAFNWDAISPAIFGALFQGVMTPKERRAKGAHYTTEKNILKVIEPLFLDELRAEFGRLKARRGAGREAALKAFHDRLATLTFFDPACGCGNFLIIAYRELRALEIDLLLEIHRDRLADIKGSFATFNVATFVKLDVDQFYGIELEEFPARIAEVALWMMDHIMNNRLSLAFGEAYARIPLRKAPHILNADALETDWSTLLAAERCSYVFGNPPFIGAKMQSEAQRAQVRRLAALGGSGGTLDYVAAWFLKAGAYVGKRPIRIGFVATNSVTQGEQVGQLWPILFDRLGLEIAFAHRTFAWGSDAKGVAHVHVVIIGLTPRDIEPAEKRLFSYADIKGDPTETRHAALSSYLVDATGLADRHLVVRETAQPLCDIPKLIIGSKPIDNGHFIFDEGERLALLKAEPDVAPLLFPFVGSEEYLNGGNRWILSLQDADPDRLRKMPRVMDRVHAVRKFREKSRSVQTRKLANSPTRYHVNVIPTRQFLVIPKVSSERRPYLPIGWLNPPVIPSDLVFVLLDATLWHFGILTSAMHMAWLRHVGGRLKSDYRYSIGLVYNSFPRPDVEPKQRQQVEKLAQAVLDARAQFPDATLAALYDPDLMKPVLRRAHAMLDVAVDRLYRAVPFGSERERAEHLFSLYERLSAPTVAAMQTPAKRPRRRI
ncbi:class I SAM-dependent DNA methyltransferase, partial [Acidiphilium sp. MT5]